MLNIINADFFRIRKGKAIYAVALGMLGVILLMVFMLKVIESGRFLEQLENDTPISVTFEGDVESYQNDIEAIQEMVPENGMQFATALYANDAGQLIVLFTLVFIIIILGVDYSSGAYRNVLSYHSKRSKIYLSKLGMSSMLAIASLFMFGLMGLVVGGAFFGFQGYTGANLLSVVTGITLMIPILLAFVAAGYCIVVFTKKTSATIAMYIIGVLVWGVIMQLAMLIFPAKQWISNLDLIGAIGRMMKYQTLTTSNILIPIGFGVAVIIVTMIIGLYKYQKTDFDFN